MAARFLRGDEGNVKDARIAALFVARGGVYYGLPDVDPWDEERDARKYQGPHPVVAHPPCERWGRYWDGGPSARGRFRKGEDGGCFEAALLAVNLWGGVLEHPAGSSAWAAFGLAKPPRAGGWVHTRFGWTCCVDQGHYGHRASKATWLYAAHRDNELLWQPADMVWGAAGKTLPLEGLSLERRARQIKTGVVQNLSHKQRKATPPSFRDVLLRIALSARTSVQKTG